MTNPLEKISKQRVSPYFCRLVICVFGSFLTNQKAHGQHSYPTAEVLQRHEIKTFTVYKSTIGFQGGLNEREKYPDFDTARQILKIFYINEFGKADSIVRHPSRSNYPQKEFFLYDSEGRLVDYQKIDSDGNELFRSRIQPAAKHELVFESYTNGKLIERQRINADGLIYQKLQYYPPDTAPSIIHTYDFENNTHQIKYESENGAYRIDTFQWFAENANPKSFKHSSEEKETGSKQPVFKEKEYELDEEGNVVNQYLGRFDDPYINYNYFERFQYLQPINFPDKDLFRADHLIYTEEASELYSFTGIERVVRYDIDYMPLSKNK